MCKKIIFTLLNFFLLVLPYIQYFFVLLLQISYNWLTMCRTRGRKNNEILILALVKAFFRVEGEIMSVDVEEECPLFPPLISNNFGYD